MFEVTRKADLMGSTSKIIKVIEAAEKGSVWAVGTEDHLVYRLAKEHSNKKIFLLSNFSCQCSTMNRIDPQHLLTVMRSLKNGEVINRISVDEDTSVNAYKALKRMLEL